MTYINVKGKIVYLSTVVLMTWHILVTIKLLFLLSLLFTMSPAAVGIDSVVIVLKRIVLVVQ